MGNEEALSTVTHVIVVCSSAEGPIYFFMINFLVVQLICSYGELTKISITNHIIPT